MTDPHPPDSNADVPLAARDILDDITFTLRDRDDDGKLTRPEFDRGRGVTARLGDPDGFERYDTSGDGLIDKAEWQAGRHHERAPDSGA